MRTLAVMNQKGGTGKTTTSVTIAALLAGRHQRTLLVDLDPQGHAGLALGVPEKRVRATIGDVLTSPDPRGDGTTSAALWSVRANLSIVTSSPRLAMLEAGGAEFARSAGRERRLHEWLCTLADDFDVCVLDCSPAIGLLTFNALVAASAVMVPIETSYFALRGADRQVAMIDAIGRRTESDLETWVLPTMHTPGEVPAERILGMLRHRYHAMAAPVAIRRDPSVAEAQALGVPIHEHAPECHASSDYQVVADWVLGRLSSLPTTHATPNTPEPAFAPRPTSRAAELADRARMMARRVTPPSHPLPVCTIESVRPSNPSAGGAGMPSPGGTDDGPRPAPPAALHQP